MTSAQAQQWFKPGYVLRTQTDTLYGNIEDKNYYDNSFQCRFKPHQSDSLITYAPENIFGYRIEDGKYYVSKQLQLDGRDTTLFMEYLINGEMDFYFVQTGGLKNHYFAANDTIPLRELNYSKQVTTIDGKLVQQELKPYAHLLNYLTGQNQAFADDIDRINNPSHKKLIKFGEKYSTAVCPDGVCIVYEKRIPNRLYLDVTAGLKILRRDTSLIAGENGTFFGVNIHLNNPNVSERGYFTLGFQVESAVTKKQDGKIKTYRNFMIPISYGFMSSKKGLSPLFSVGFNFRYHMGFMANSLTFAPGVKYDFGDYFVKLYAEAEVLSMFIFPVNYYSTNFGISFCYRLNRMDK